MTKVLWALVAYRNLSQVDDYIDHLNSLTGHDDFQYAICDNSPVTGVSRHAQLPGVTFVGRPDNPGYLEGALVAMEAHVVRDTEERPDWVALSNTDLVVESDDLLGHLAKYPSADPYVIAPRITEGDSGIEKNPHVLMRRSLRRLHVNALIGLTSATTMAYQAASVLRWNVSRRRLTSRHDSATWAQVNPTGTTMYSPYGAVMFFSAGFLMSGRLPRNVPLLAEEYFIAEAAADVGAPVVYEPGIHFHHSAHITTGKKVARGRARRTAHAFREIHADARKRDNSRD